MRFWSDVCLCDATNKEIFGKTGDKGGGRWTSGIRFSEEEEGGCWLVAMLRSFPIRDNSSN